MLAGNLRTMGLPEILQWISAGRKTGTLEPVDDRRHRARGQSGVLGQPPRGRGAGHLEEIEALEVGRVDADEFRHRVAEQHRLGADLAQGFLQLLQQVRP